MGVAFGQSPAPNQTFRNFSLCIFSITESGDTGCLYYFYL